MHKLHTILGPLVNASGLHVGAEHSACRARNIENGKTMAETPHTHGGGKWSTCLTWTGVCLE